MFIEDNRKLLNWNISAATAAAEGRSIGTVSTADPEQSPEEQQRAAMEQQIWRQAPQQTPAQRHVLQEFAPAQQRVAAEEQGATKKYPDYQESIAKLPADGPTPFPPTAYCYLMMNVENPTALHIS